MTNRQKIVTEVSGWLTLLVTVVGAVLALFPQFGATALGGGVTIGLLMHALRNVIIPRLNQYSHPKPRPLPPQPTIFPTPQHLPPIPFLTHSLPTSPPL